MLKKIYYVFISLLLLVLSNQLFGQISYECTIGQIENAVQDSILIEVFIISSGDPFVFGTSIFTIEANKSIDLIKPRKNTEGPWDDGIDEVNYSNITLVETKIMDLPPDNAINATNYGDSTFAKRGRKYEGTKYVGLKINKIANGGLIVPNTTTLVGSFRLPIKETGGFSEVAWHRSGTNSVVVTDTNGTDITANGSFTEPPSIPLPVELTSFTASVKSSKVILNWHTATEVNNYGFEVHRSEISEQNLEDEWENIGFVEGHGNSNSPKDYSFVDTNPTGSYVVKYRLKQIDLDGAFEYSNEIVVKINRPVMNSASYKLCANYPNPFNPTTKIQFDLKEHGNVVLRVFNVIGEEITVLVDESLEIGIHEVEFNASNLASGIYYYQLQFHNQASGTGYSDIMKMLMIK